MSKKQKDKRRLKSLSPMAVMVPHIMKSRTGSQNFVTDSVDIDRMEAYLKEKKAQGMENISPMHVFIAAYVRIVSQRPAVNRFIRGQKIYTRRSVEISLTIKKEMTLDSPDTVVKITVQPDASIEDIYNELNNVITGYRDDPGGDFDKVAGAFSKIPSLFLSLTVSFLRMLDYFGLMPKLIERVSPFHSSMFITSMGSLGIPPIYHHLYDFGTCPVFIAFGKKNQKYEIDREGGVHRRRYMDFAVVMDERICDGFYYASTLHILQNIMKNPWQLDQRAHEVIEDVR